MTSRYRWGVCPILACVVAVISAAPGITADKGSHTVEPAAVAYTYSTPEGESYFALALKAPGTAAPAVVRNHVVLIDTSASQAGEHRAQALAVVKELLAVFPSKDRVALFAIDVTAERLSEGFISPQGSAADAAFAKLEGRAPLGATDLQLGLRAALAISSNEPTSITYIGDGMSIAGLIQKPEMASLLGEMRSRRIFVHSYAVGPRTDLQLLGVLAQQTGGTVRFDRADADLDAPQHVAQMLAASAASPAIDAGAIHLESVANVQLIASTLPLRADRATLYFGTGKLPKSLKVTASAAGQSLSWTVDAGLYRAGGPYLASLCRQSSENEGLCAASAGIELLTQAQREFDVKTAQLAQAGEVAVAARNIEAADSVSRTIRQTDPDNARALAISRAVDRIRKDEVAQAGAAPKADAAPPKPGSGLEAKKGPPSDNALSQYEKLKVVKGQQLTLEVSRAIEAARKQAFSDPESSLAELKRQDAAVRSATDIDPDVRNQLVLRLAGVMQEVRVEKERDDLKKLKQAESRAAIEAQKRVVDQMLRDEERMTQLIGQVRSLMYEGYHSRHGGLTSDAFEEAEAVARVADGLRPGDATSTAAIIWAEAAGQISKAYRMRALRADKFLETLYQVELSHVPFPDEPPILWPNAQVWRALTERRKKWASVDLRKNSPAEQHIEAQLDTLTNIDFTETPLGEAMAFVGTLHNFTVLLDKKALGEVPIAVDEPITAQLSGITLRSALKIVLEPLQLTYVIEDEVMKITTIEQAGLKLQTRVYPVADLVIPIQSFSSGGGGAGGGGQFGGGGGGQFGGGGGGQFGGGGGQFSVPASATPRSSKVGAPQPGREVADPEIQGLLKNIHKDGKKTTVKENTSRSTRPSGQAFAQVLDNNTSSSLKKKPLLSR